ncbi:fibronectin type III domain-containing protein [Taibaiella koreensis]|uniref:fibronectin type III domain-containing protein n=1 Tax=Taibaiella koreensis TaxID=1268548 RepID=UPI000E59F397|nr:fibronectin type III domain-containing protein [Taibaiella koreensis]
MQNILNIDIGTKAFLPTFTTYFDRLLRPVDQWILTEIMDDWREKFKDPLAESDYRLFMQAARDYLLQKRKQRNIDITWLEAILFISLQRFSKAVDKPVIWTTEFVAYQGNKAIDANEEVLKKVLELYNSWCDNPGNNDNGFAQPYAFYLVFNTVVEDDVLRKYISMRSDNDPLKIYLTIGEQGASKLDNRIVNFAIDYYRNGKRLIAPTDTQQDIYATAHFRLLNLKSVNIDHIIDQPVTSARIKITAMGIMASGKSTIFKRMREVLTSPSGGGSYDSNFAITQLSVIRNSEGEGEVNNFFGSISRRTAASRLDTTELTGQIAINNQQYDISVNDTRGGIMLASPPKYDRTLSLLQDQNYPLERLLLETDLLLLVMDPETIFYQDAEDVFTFGNLLDLIESRLDYLFHHSKHAMIAVVFTKFDEYGSVIKGPRNLIHSEEQAAYLKQFLETGDESILNRLISAIGDTYVKRNKEDTLLRQTIMLLLNRLKFLLRRIVHSRRHPVINFYIASTASMKDNERSHWTGITDVFNDFSDYLGWLIKKKQELRILPPSGVTVTNSNAYPELSFENRNEKDMSYVVERKINDGSFNVCESGRVINAKNGSVFTDKDAEFGKLYTYRLYFVDFSSEKNASKYSEEVAINLPLLPILPPVEISAGLSEGSVLIEWRNANRVAVKNLLERKQPGEEFRTLVNLKEQNGSIARYVDKDIDHGKNYIYRLRAHEAANTDNFSAFSDEIKVVVPRRKLIPPALLQAALLNDRIKLSWKNENGFSIGFTIERKLTGNAEWRKLSEAQKQDAHSGFYLDNDAELGKEYIYRIRFATLDNEPVYSDPVETNPVKTPPMGIENLDWELKPGKDQVEYVELKWKEPENLYAVFYKLSRKTKNREGGFSAPIDLKTNFKGSQHRDTIIKKGCSYQYEIQVFDASGGTLPMPATETEIIAIPTSNSALAILLIVIIVLIIVFLLIKISGLV